MSFPAHFLNKKGYLEIHFINKYELLSVRLGIISLLVFHNFLGSIFLLDFSSEKKTCLDLNVYQDSVGKPNTANDQLDFNF